jgi:tellurite resistance protein
MSDPRPSLIPRETMERLRDALRARGQRPSMVMTGPRTSAELIEAIEIVEEYGPLCEAMYLVMAADNRVVQAEREVLRGALDVLSSGRVRTIHLEAMLDAAARKCTKEGRDARLRAVIEILSAEPARAEATAILAAAVAAADSRIVPEEHEILDALFQGLGLDRARATEIVEGLQGALGETKEPT